MSWTIKEYSEAVCRSLHAAFQYYQMDDPVMSDYEYDILYKNIKEWEIDNEKRLHLSPTQFVGSPLKMESIY